MFQLCMALRAVVKLVVLSATVMGRTHIATSCSTKCHFPCYALNLATSCHHDQHHDVCRLKPHSQGSCADSRVHKHHSQSKTDVCSLSTAARRQAPGLLSHSWTGHASTHNSGHQEVLERKTQICEILSPAATDEVLMTVTPASVGPR